MALAAQHYQALPAFTWLKPVSLLYGQVAQLIRSGYQTGVFPRTRLPVPVISVGNITTGGTGKTPITIAITRLLSSHGYRVLVLSRGYRSKRPYQLGEKLTPEHGDEPYCIQQAVPNSVVYVGRQRAQLARQALSLQRFDVVVLDDGHQHHALHKDLDLVLLDAKRGLGNGHCLPLGPCREPWQVLPGVTYVWVHKTDKTFSESPDLLPASPLPPGLTGHNTAASVLGTVFHHHGHPVEANWCHNRRIILIAGIANPTPLVETLIAHGAMEVQPVLLPDHVRPSPIDWKNWQAQALQTQAVLVTTLKDWVKAPQDPGFWDIPPVVADLNAMLPAKLESMILNLLTHYPTQPCL